MTPFADAMCFIDRDLGNVPVERALQKRFKHQPLRRDVQHAVVSAMQPAPACNRFLSLQRGIQKRCRNPAGLQRIDLIFHQRNQRRHDNRKPIAHQSGQLKTERLAATGRHQHKHIPPGERIANDLLLQRPELVVAEMLFERADQIHSSKRTTSSAGTQSNSGVFRPLCNIALLILGFRPGASVHFFY